MTRNGQTSMEFVIILSVLLVLFLIFTGLSYYRMDQLRRETNQKVLEGVSELFKTEVQLALSSTECYVRDFALPQHLNNLDYELHKENREILFTYEGVERVVLLSDKVKTNCIVRGENRIVKKKDSTGQGIVYINPNPADGDPCTNQITLMVC